MIPKDIALKQTNKKQQHCVLKPVGLRRGVSAAYHCVSNSRAVIILSHACRRELAAKYMVALQPAMYSRQGMGPVLQRQ